MIIKANGFSLSPRRFIAGTRGSYGTAAVDFIFSEEWGGLAKTVSFYPASGDPVSVIYSGSPIPIPAEVMAHAGIARFTVSGISGTTALISVSGIIDVLETPDPAALSAEPPTPSEMAQVLTMMNNAVSTAQSVRRDADNGVFDGVGIDGRSAYIHIRYSSEAPCSDSQIKQTPDDWIGIYYGDSSTAPSSFSLYSWYKIKGETGVDGRGVPDGGSAGQLLAKTGPDDCDTEWKSVVRLFTDVFAAVWTEDDSCAGFGYKCVLSLPGVTADSAVDVTFGAAEAVSGKYAPVCLSGNGTVTVYSKTDDAVTIPWIKAVCI